MEKFKGVKRKPTYEMLVSSFQHQKDLSVFIHTESSGACSGSGYLETGLLKLFGDTESTFVHCSGYEHLPHSTHINV